MAIDLQNMREEYEVKYKDYIDDRIVSFNNLEDAIKFARDKQEQGPVRVTKVTKELVYGKN